MEGKKYLIALSAFSKFGSKRIKRLKKYFLNFKDAFKADFDDLIKAGIEKNIAEEFINERKKIIPEKICESLNHENIKIISLENKNYPKLLKEIYDPPYLLYYKGNIKKDFSYSVAIVGTRKYSSYGEQVAEKLAFELSKNNITIVSGLALGIDTIAHKTCLRANGNTIAVLGSGLDNKNIYPGSNKNLVNNIILNNGCIISEFAPGTPPLRHNFPQRNRIIAGLSLGVIVVEAKKRSGALITANHALEQNREVFAVPGNIFSENSKGPNNLLKMGARLVSESDDVLETLNLTKAIEFTNNKKIIGETKEEEIIISFLSHEPMFTDELIRKTKLDASKISSTLTIMEMKGMIKNIGGAQYILAR
jgi:DNA processing protein